MIRPAEPGDIGPISEIYNHYVANTVVTFEEVPVPVLEMAARIRETADAGLPWLVASAGDRVLGFAYASKWKGRCAYRFSVETTIYLAPDQHRRGLGSGLYAELLSRLEDRGLRVALAGISLPNEASVRLHEKLGFRQVGRFEAVGFKLDRWIDVGYWQLAFSTSGRDVERAAFPVSER